MFLKRGDSTCLIECGFYFYLLSFVCRCWFYEILTLKQKQYPPERNNMFYHVYIHITHIALYYFCFLSAIYYFINSLTSSGPVQKNCHFCSWKINKRNFMMILKNVLRNCLLGLDSDSEDFRVLDEHKENGEDTNGKKQIFKRWV